MAVDAPWSRATATRVAVDPATAALTVVSTTHVPALLAFTAADVLPSRMLLSGYSTVLLTSSKRRYNKEFLA